MSDRTSASSSAERVGPERSSDSELLRLFGYRGFRRLQKPIVEAILSGRDVLAVLPTGAGKSVCFQLPALMSDGVTLVISPLISLMQDQVASLRRRGLPAADLTSATPAGDRRVARAAVANGTLRLLYVSPEMLGSPRFRELWRERRPARVVVDEAHCISEWGHDFRPSYRRIGEFVRFAGYPPIAAFTATATSATRRDVEDCLRLRVPLRVVAPVDRPNIRWTAGRTASLGEAVHRAGDAVRGALRSDPSGAAILYIPTRARAAHAAGTLRRLGVPAAYYHAGLDDRVRRSVQAGFLGGESRVICATSAFGMGIDHPRIRLVSHCGMPGALESYVQEAGRAGRDGRPAHALLLVTPRDRQVHSTLLRAADHADPGARRRARERLRVMMGYVSCRTCRRSYIARYFGEPAPRCAGCDRCGTAGQP